MPYRNPLKILFLRPLGPGSGEFARLLEKMSGSTPHAAAVHDVLEDALVTAIGGGYDVVVLRCYGEMPPCLQLLEQFRDSAEAPPVVVVADEYDEPTDEACIAAGAADFLAVQELTPSLLERFLRQTVARAEASRDRRLAIDLRDRILTVLAHDVRGPLAILQDGLGYYQERFDYQPPKKIRQFMRQAKDQTGQMLHLLSQLLEWARSQTKDLRPRHRPVALGEVVEDILQGIGPMAQEKFVGIDLRQKDPPEVWTDENMLRAILRNLLGNALKFSPQGSTILIEVVEVEDGSAVEVRVRDEGMGISAEDQRRLLHGESVAIRQGTNREKGTGFGFLLCMHFAKLIQAQLDLDSKEGDGTTAILSLPLGASAEEFIERSGQRVEGVRH